MSKFFKVFTKTVAITASVAGIAYVIKQIMDKRAAEDAYIDEFDSFDEEAASDSMERSREYIDLMTSQADAIKEAAEDAAEKAADIAGEAAEAVEEAVGEIKETVEDTVEEVKEIVEEAAEEPVNPPEETEGD